MLGGTRFLGRHVVEEAQRRGHHVTLFTRGLTDPTLFPEAEHRRGDRDDDLSSLEGRHVGRRGRHVRLLPPPGAGHHRPPARTRRAWVVHLLEGRHTGTFNAVGPAWPLSFGLLLETGIEALGADAEVIWIPEADLVTGGRNPGASSRSGSRPTSRTSGTGWTRQGRSARTCATDRSRRPSGRRPRRRSAGRDARAPVPSRRR